jgi:Trypsin-co-occurring domain 2
MSVIAGADIEQVIAGVKRAIRAAQQSDEGVQTITIDKLELTLKGSVEKNVGGELKIKIPVIDTGLGASAEVTNKELQTIQLTLVPVKSTTRSSTRPEAFEKELIEAIKVIREGIKNAAAGEPKFTLQNAFVELNFVVNSKGEISFLAKGSGQSESAQTVKLFLSSA